VPSDLPTLEIRPLGLDGVLEIVPERDGDARGFLSETYRADRLAEAGIRVAFVQENHAYSARRGTLRGLHFQAPPFAQGKLARVVRGAVFDVAVDIRRGSPGFGRWVGLTVSAARWNQVWVPEGFAHGFLTLEPETEVLYKLTAPYAPGHGRAIRFDDPAIAIAWPLAAGEISLSDRDRAAPLLDETETGLTYS
jgi:dTDP-4-dehydrorhamnose 3,5-epimerase